MPCASSRSSSSAASVSSAAASSSGDQLPLVVIRGGRAGEAQVVGEREQPLLGAVVKVALEPAARGVAGLDDAGARGLECMELGHRLGAQCLVLDGQLRRRSQSARKLRLVHECRIVNHERERAVAAGDPGDRAAGARRIGGSAVGVDQPARAAPRIEHVDSRVAEGYGKRVAQHAWPRRVPQVSGQASQTRACARYAHEAPGEPEREQGVRDRAGEEDRGEPGPVRILERRSQERDRIGRLGRADQERRAENREQRAPARAGCSEQPAPGEGHETQRNCELRPEQQVAQRARDPRIGMDEERVVRAVAPAVQVEQRIAKRRAADRQKGDERVCGDDRDPRRSRTHPPVGDREREVEDEHERERSDQRPEAPEEGRGVLGALTVHPEPREAGEHGEHAEAPGSRLCGGEPARQDQSEAGREVGRTCGGERGGVGGVEIAAVTDRGQAGHGPGERQRHAGEHGQAQSRGEARVRHRPILASGALLPATVFTERILWLAAMCRAPGGRTVLLCHREE